MHRPGTGCDRCLWPLVPAAPSYPRGGGVVLWRDGGAGRGLAPPSPRSRITAPNRYHSVKSLSIRVKSPSYSPSSTSMASDLPNQLAGLLCQLVNPRRERPRARPKCATLPPKTDHLFRLPPRSFDDAAVPLWSARLVGTTAAAVLGLAAEPPPAGRCASRNAGAAGGTARYTAAAIPLAALPAALAHGADRRPR
jgi:hypothetical protein